MKHYTYSIDSNFENQKLISDVRHYNSKNQTQSLVVLYNPNKQGLFDVFVYSYLDTHPLLVARFHSVRGLMNYLFKCPYKNLAFFSINPCRYE